MAASSCGMAMNESMDDTDDDESIFFTELGVLREICGEEIQVDDESAPSSVSITLHPATAGNKDAQYVCLTLIVKVTKDYPNETPTFDFRSPRGMSDEELERISCALKRIAEERTGSEMLYDLIQAAKDSLTENNTPSLPCAICLCAFEIDDVFTKTECYHYFHSYCLAQHIEHCLENEPEKQIGCPNCREPINSGNLSQLKEAPRPAEESAPIDGILVETRQWQEEMRAVFERQKARGGHIDVEEEKNKYLISIRHVPTTSMDEILSQQLRNATLNSTDQEPNSQSNDTNKLPAQQKDGRSGASADNNNRTRINNQNRNAGGKGNRTDHRDRGLRDYGSKDQRSDHRGQRSNWRDREWRDGRPGSGGRRDRPEKERSREQHHSKDTVSRNERHVERKDRERDRQINDRQKDKQKDKQMDDGQNSGPTSNRQMDGQKRGEDSKPVGSSRTRLRQGDANDARKEEEINDKKDNASGQVEVDGRKIVDQSSSSLVAVKDLENDGGKDGRRTDGRRSDSRRGTDNKGRDDEKRTTHRGATDDRRKDDKQTTDDQGRKDGSQAEEGTSSKVHTKDGSNRSIMDNIMKKSLKRFDDRRFDDRGHEDRGLRGRGRGRGTYNSDDHCHQHVGNQGRGRGRDDQRGSDQERRNQRRNGGPRGGNEQNHQRESKSGDSLGVTSRTANRYRDQEDKDAPPQKGGAESGRSKGREQNWRGGKSGAGKGRGTSERRNEEDSRPSNKTKKEDDSHPLERNDKDGDRNDSAKQTTRSADKFVRKDGDYNHQRGGRQVQSRERGSNPGQNKSGGRNRREKHPEDGHGRDKHDQTYQKGTKVQESKSRNEQDKSGQREFCDSDRGRREEGKSQKAFSGSGIHGRSPPGFGLNPVDSINDQPKKVKPPPGFDDFR